MSGLICFRCVSKWVWLAALVCFVAAAWAGKSSVHVKPPNRPGIHDNPPPVKVQCIFRAYDPAGKRLPGAYFPAEKTTMDGDVCNASNYPGVHEDLTFQWHGETVTVTVTWRSLTEYEGWLHGEFLNAVSANPRFKPANWDENFAEFKKYSNEIKEYVPIVFPNAIAPGTPTATH
jgi:hypothetical protein